MVHALYEVRAEENNIPAVVMEMCSGEFTSLVRTFSSRQLTPSAAVQVAVQTATLEVATQQAHVRYVHTTATITPD
eukprot:3966759-Amphidinium_carterae.1